MKTRLLILSISVLLLAACGKDDASSFRSILHPFQCESLTVTPCLINPDGIPFYSEGDYPSSSFALEIKLIGDNIHDDNYPWGEGDATLERRIKAYLKNAEMKWRKETGGNYFILSSSPPEWYYTNTIIYSTERLKSIRISCTEQFYDRKAGENLNDFFSLFFTYGFYSPLIKPDSAFLTPKKIIRFSSDETISLTDYLAAQPYAAHSFIVRLNKMPSGFPEKEVQFTIEIDVDKSGKKVYTTEPITLI